MGEYIKDIRAVIGNQTLVLACTCIYVFNRNRQILMQHRTDNHLWSCPGGIIEIDELVDVSAAREVREETGLVVSDLKLVGVASGPGMRYTYPNGDDVSNVSIIYAAQVETGTATRTDEESHELRWVDLPVSGISLTPPSAYMFDLYPAGAFYDRFYR